MKTNKKQLTKKQLEDVIIGLDSGDSLIAKIFHRISQFSYVILCITYFLFMIFIISIPIPVIYFFIFMIFIGVIVLYYIILSLRKSLFIMEENKLNELATNFTDYFKTKGKKGTLEVQHFKNKISKAYYNLNRFEKLFNFHFSIFICFLSIYYFFLLLPKISTENNDHITIIFFLIIGLIISFYFWMIFGIKSRAIKIINMCKILFGINYFKHIDSNINKIEKIIFSKMNDFELNQNDILEILTNWINLYYCVFYTNEELNQLLLDYKSLYFTLNVEEYHIQIFNDLRFKIKDFNIRDDNKGIQKNYTNFKILLDLLENYIEILEFDIKKKKDEIKERRDKYHIWYFSISLILSITALFISLI